MGIDALVRNNVHLTEIVLDCCLEMRDDTLVHILNLPNISCIRLGVNRSVRGDGVLNMTSTSIHTFEVSFFKCLTTENQLRILRAFPRKDILNVSLRYLTNVCDGFARDYSDLLREFKSAVLYTLNGYKFIDGKVIF